MRNGVLTAFGIAAVSLVIPVFYLASPFIGGFIGGGMAKADSRGKVITFGLMVAGLMLIPASALIAMVLFLTGDAEGIPLGPPRQLALATAIAIVPYTWFGVTAGALISCVLRQKEARANARGPSHR